MHDKSGYKDYPKEKHKEYQENHQNFNVCLKYYFGGNTFNNKDSKVMLRLDHQIGRFSITEEIFKKIKNENLKGDIMELGVWKGQNLVFLNYLKNKYLDNRKIYGIDGFEGLPISEDGWQKGMFSDSSIQIVKNNIKKYFNNTTDIELFKGYFNQTKTHDFISNIDNLIFIYYDADLKTSTLDALNLTKRFILKNKKMFIGFDDWGCKGYSLLPAFGQFFHHLKNISFKVIGSTRYTIFFEITNDNL
jgi:hypothetical protein